MLLPSKVAQRFGVSHVTLRKWVRDGHIPALTLPSGHMRFNEEDVERFEQYLKTRLRRQRQSPPVERCV